MSDEGTRKASRLPLWVAFVASAVWIAASLVLLKNTNTCSETATAVAITEIDTWLTCRNANEIGDFLAGVFAPLAFILLAATVWMQSSELQAQREELRLARAEAEGTRKALEAQAEESKKNVELIARQTIVLEHQAAQESQKEADYAFDQYVDILNSVAQEGAVEFLIEYRSKKNILHIQFARTHY